MKKINQQGKEGINNTIEIGSLRVASENASIKELMEVVDKILSKHKEIVSKEKSLPMMFG